MVEKVACETLSIGIDSGAAVTIVPKAVAADYPINNSKESRAGVTYRTASGDIIQDLGQRGLQLHSNSSDGRPSGLKARVGDVHKALLAVCEMVDAGHDVNFRRRDGKDASHCIHIATGKRTDFVRRNGVYEIDTKIIPYEQVKAQESKLAQKKVIRSLEEMVGEIEMEVEEELSRKAWHP